MKTLIFIFLTTLTCISSCDAGLAGFLTQKRQDWKFIQAVGGMKISVEKKRLVVSCDVSGLKNVTKKPTIMNSGIGVRKLKCTRSGNIIKLTVVTSVFEKGMTSDCGSVDISSYPPGSYSVIYLNPDRTTQPLGVISLP